MARREPNTTKALEISVLFEPSWLSPACVAQAYEEGVPLTQRITSRASHRGLVVKTRCNLSEGEPPHDPYADCDLCPGLVGPAGRGPYRGQSSGGVARARRGG